MKSIKETVIFYFLFSKKLFEDCQRVQHQPSLGTVADFTGPNDHRHHQVLLHLHVGPFRLRMR